MDPRLFETNMNLLLLFLKCGARPQLFINSKVHLYQNKSNTINSETIKRSLLRKSFTWTGKTVGDKKKLHLGNLENNLFEIVIKFIQSLVGIIQMYMCQLQ